MAGRGVKVHRKYVVLWAKHLQMGPTKIIWGPQKSSSCLPPSVLINTCFPSTNTSHELGRVGLFQAEMDCTLTKPNSCAIASNAKIEI